MRFEYDSSPIRGTVIAVVVIVIISLLLPDTLLRLIGLSIAAGPALWAFIQWRKHGRGVQFDERDLVVQIPLPGRTRHIPYSDILGCGATTDGGLIVAYVRRVQQSNTQDYPAISRVALAQARPIPGVRRSVISTPRLKDIQGCLATLSERQEQNLSGLAQQFSEETLRSLAGRKRLRNTLLFVLAVLATPLYVIAILRLISIVH